MSLKARIEQLEDALAARVEGGPTCGLLRSCSRCHRSRRCSKCAISNSAVTSWREKLAFPDVAHARTRCENINL